MSLGLTVFCRVQRKQNKYPTLLLTNGEDVEKYVPYLDLRTRSIDMAIYFATFSNLLVGFPGHFYYYKDERLNSLYDC